MKIMNVILSVVCALVIGLSAMLYIQKGKAVRAGEERLAKISSLEADLADAQAKRDALATAREQLEVQLKSETTRERSMSADLLSLKRDNDAASERLRALASELRTKTAEVAQLAEARRTLIGRFTEELRNREVAVTEGGDSTSLELAGSTLFRPGQVELSEQGKEALKQVAERIKEMGDKMIRVEGHTDNVPVRRQKDMYETNWEVSLARATNVVRYLVDEVGIPPERLEAVGMSQYHPIADNSTAEGREKNRRIVLKLKPLPPGSVAPVAPAAPAPAAAAE